MIDVQDKLQNRKSIDIKKEYEYIEFLNKYQKYFNFSKYNLIPNSYGELLKISELEDYNDIPEEILFEIKILFFKDLKKNSICNGINIEGIVKKSMYNIGEIIENCFKIKKKEEDSKFDYKNTYQICKVIIKYIPVNEDIKENQKRLYNLYKLFDKDIGDMIEINSSANLYNHVNKGIIQYINEQINNCSDITKTKNYIKDIFKFINENYDILNPNKYKILPNQLGKLKRLDELQKDNNILEELKDITSGSLNVKELLMDNRINKFNPSKIMSNEDLKKYINDLIKKKK